ncbi:hypothetical protein, conserved [Trypanosoma brucei brucei TREU927]|uniref:Uncharacterized protein n=1 Tax=Trypanosoma brucei brucei (strain 927/4 GUTat10.1) TaxID=185431 RepID=Q389Y0_TRYB2|nr:hypothetical protein, conserved [Trypanosoma brucei brucei TREU927]EAN78390.1 hypothetical protein, conserved [Trypanosoma brucei brucei TREU927]
MTAGLVSSFGRCGGAAAALSTVLHTRQPLPFVFFTKWAMHDFHTSRWSRARSDSQLRRTHLGRKCTETPMMEMVSVNRYGGNAKREALALAFRTYRSVCQSSETLQAGREAVSQVQLDDFAFGDDEMEEVATDFACLYLNATVLFVSPPSEEMMVGLLSCLSKVLHNSFHWECVLSVLVALLHPEATSARVFVTAFTMMLRESLGESVPKTFSRDGVVLLLLSVARATAILRENEASSKDMVYLLALQQNALVELCCTPGAAPLPREELLVLTDAICWRFAATGGCLHLREPSLDSVVKQLQLSSKAVLDVLVVSECTKLFCASCLALVPPSSEGNPRPQCQHQWQTTLDPLVSHLDRLVRVHSIVDALCVFVGLSVNGDARARYRKYPLALLEHLQEEQDVGNIFTELLRSGGSDVFAALTSTLTELRNSGEDDLADAVSPLLNALSTEVPRAAASSS